MKQQPKKYKLANVLWEQDVWNLYYGGMETVREKRITDALGCFRKIVWLNPEFPGGYEGFAAIATIRGRKHIARSCIAAAFKKVLAAYPNWPRRLPWGETENRPMLRIIQMWAMVYHEDGNRKEAEKLYRLLLKLNPSDNQGIRYLLAGMKQGLTPDDIDAA